MQKGKKLTRQFLPVRFEVAPFAWLPDIIRRSIRAACSRRKLLLKSPLITMLPYLPVVAVLLLQCQAFAGSSKKVSGKTLYDRGCWSCHADKNSNIIDPEKTIAKSDKLQSLSSFKQFLSKPHGKMPPWNTIVREPEELKSLYQYVQSLKTSKPDTAVH